jgi:epoxyqueuosine reductase
MEKPLAEAAGIGWQGKHSNLVSRRHGNWLFLAAIYSAGDWPPLADQGATASCGSCSACITACPTGAIVRPYVVDARACISYLTIEHKGPIPPEYRRAIGNRIYGCDDCLAVCPWNRFAHVPAEAALLPRAELAAPLLADFLALDEAAFRALFRGSPVKRIGRDRFVRNCLIAAGNSADPALAPAVARLLDDPSPIVGDAARWALSELAAGP